MSEENLKAIIALSKLEGILIENRPQSKDIADEQIKIVLDCLMDIAKD